MNNLNHTEKLFLKIKPKAVGLQIASFYIFMVYKRYAVEKNENI